MNVTDQLVSALAFFFLVVAIAILESKRLLRVQVSSVVLIDFFHAEAELTVISYLDEFDPD